MSANSEFKTLAEAANAAFTVESAAREVSEAELAWAAERMAKSGYIMTEASVAALNAYLAGYAIMIGGNVGTGKTLFFSALDKAGIRTGHREIVRISLLEVSAYSLDRIVGMVDSARDREMLVDDIMAESLYSNYGCKIELLPWLVEQRIGLPVRTHFTTNRSAADIEKRYGARLADRLHEMCRGFSFTGASMRQTRVVEADRRWTREDWALCAERCLRFDGHRCMAGCKTPPDKCDLPRPPEECIRFLAK